MTAIAAVLALPRFAAANPTGGVVVDGSANISSAGSVTNVAQSTNRAVIDWQSFSIASGETVNFLQPSALSVTLNRVVGNESSVIAGALNANGNVFIVNSAGVLFTKNAEVNVGGLVASTRDISNNDFMAGNYVFSGSSAAAVVNRGTITAADGGYVVLLGRSVSNEGAITAKLGSIALASGDKITLNFGGDSLLDVTIDKGTYDALVENKGLIKADGGRVVMAAKAADAVLSAQVNNSGIIQARTLADLTGGPSSRGTVKIGQIKLLASGGTTKVTGKLDASAPNGGKGGTIETSGNKVTIAEGAEVTTASSTGETGSWIIDPDGFTIASSGGDITGALLGSLLANNNITLWSTSGGGTDGNIYVNDAVRWSGSTILTLNATSNIYVNAAITATGKSAGLALNYGNYASASSATSGTDYYIDTDTGGKVTLSGSSASLVINGAAYTLLHSMNEIAAFTGQTVTGNYALARDLDATGTTYDNALIDTFIGTFAGLGHTISNLTISSGSNGANFIATMGGFFVSDPVGIRDIGLVNVSMTGGDRSAGLVGANYGGTIYNAYATGTVVGDGSNVGGLVGTNFGGTISNSHADVDVAGVTNVGGLVGWNLPLALRGLQAVITDSYATGNVTAYSATSIRSNFGGLVGWNSGGLISNSYATGAVDVGAANSNSTDLSNVGGLVGSNGYFYFAGSGASYVGTIVNSYATGNVTSPGSNIGGLVGINEGNISGSYASGNVTSTAATAGGATNIGGLVGLSSVSEYTNYTGVSSGNISDSYATGNVYAPNASSVGGLVGGVSGSTLNNKETYGTISNSWASGNVTGYMTVGGLVGFSVRSAISDSSASGNVMAILFGAGGLVGTNAFGAISNSTASGDVSQGSPDDGRAGGLVGYNYGAIENSSATGSVTNGSSGLVGVNDSGSGTVTNSTYRDAKAEARAATQAQATQIQQTALSAANVLTSAAANVSSKPPNPTLSTASGKSAIMAAVTPSVSENMQNVEPAETPPPAARARPRHVLAVAAQKPAVRHGGGYGSRIRSIEVDGQRFDYNDGKNNAPGTNAR
ncbi:MULTISPECIES: beta strand repeat-containing protein [Methylosinus]|uniref:beta strand repeat-containing protein n=2 Tax=Methylocystaceae TaxID=31993 RepID=UPI0002FAEE63|nr:MULTISPECIES: GLUG motif-containing protein [Methylosinus]